MGFKITKDNVHTAADEIAWNKTGMIFKCTCEDPFRYAEGTHAFQVLDDDGNICFEGVSDDDSCFCPLDWSEPLCGSTEIRYQDEETKEYKTL
ncbi:hypothetical protein [Paenibacillus sinopodophylli]|uniref:hypothetical protein n=1 Tax=Paenibacillus sinopodophylli TaxID=1837342 RepID=UPI00110D004D|nr:hypothetical protein [Paenibacillus sinopodophylli]